jgi:hypothetical protein
MFKFYYRNRLGVGEILNFISKAGYNIHPVTVDKDITCCFAVGSDILRSGCNKTTVTSRKGVRLTSFLHSEGLLGSSVIFVLIPMDRWLGSSRVQKYLL